MKKIFFVITLLLGFGNTFGQDEVGYWSGSLKVGGEDLQLIFNVGCEKDLFFATLSVPQQGVKNIEATNVEVADGEIIMEFEKGLKARYWGEFVGDSLIEGKFTQNGFKFDLNLRRSNGEVAINRPQEPVAPFEYNVSEIEFINEKGDTLSGTLTVPFGKGRFPAVVMVTGSGPQDRNEEILGHKPFLVIADFLTRNGIAVLRYDERGVGKSQGTFLGATTNDFYKDAVSGIDFLRKHKEIDSKKIGLIGHSEGGTIAFMAAANDKVNFAISLAGAAVRGDSILIQQNYDILTSSGVSKEVAKQYVDILREIFKIQNSQTKEEIKNNLEAIKTQIFTGKENMPVEFKKNATAVLTGDNEWLKAFRNNDPTLYLGKIKCKLLALNGDKDVQVNADINLGSVKRLVPHAKIVKYKSLNHLFQECKTGMVNEYGTIEQTISQTVLDDIANWILSL